MKKSSDLGRGRHVVFDLNVHLVFVTKYRRGVISEQVFSIIRASCAEVCKDFGANLVEANFEADHVHLLVNYPSKVAISSLVNSLKGVSSRRVRKAELPEVNQSLWGDHFWSPSYCAVSCGGAPLDVIKKYIQNQSGSKGGLASSPS